MIDYSVVTYSGHTYCVECLPDWIHWGDPAVRPIRLSDAIYICSECGAAHYSIPLPMLER